MFYSSLSLVNIWQQEKTLERKKGERCNKGLRWFKPENKLLLHSRIWGIYCHVHFHTRETLKLHSNTHLTICSIHVRLLRHKKVQHQTKLMKSSDSQLVGYCQKKFNFNRLCCSPKLNFVKKSPEEASLFKDSSVSQHECIVSGGYSLDIYSLCTLSSTQQIFGSGSNKPLPRETWHLRL